MAEFPRLKIIIYHLGWPFFDNALYMLYAYPSNVYLEITGNMEMVLSKSHFRRMVIEAVETDSQRIVFGSDQMFYPVIGPSVEAILGAEYLSDESKRLIFWENPMTIWDL